MHQLDTWLASLQQHGRLPRPEDALALLGRQADAPPHWLALAALAARQPGTSALDALLSATDSLGKQYGPADWHEPPAALLRRCALQVAHGWQGPRAAQGVLPAMPAEYPAGVCETIIAQRDIWLANAAARHLDVLDAAGRWPIPAEIPPQHGVQLPVLLIDPLQKGRGIVARLQMWRVPAKDAALRLVPAPCSATLPQTRRFAQSLATVRECLLFLLQRASLDDPGRRLPDALQNTALAWDLSAEQASLVALDGDSAGATLALSALRLLADAAPETDWRPLLQGIDRTRLRTFVVSAGIDRLGKLWPVGGIAADAKPEALQPLAQALNARPDGPPLLHLCIDQPGTGLLNTLALPWQGHTNLFSLANAAAPQDGIWPGPWQTLHEALLADSQPRLPDDLLRQAATQGPAHTLQDHALRQWARWETELPGHVQAHFVSLDVKPDAAGPLRPRIDPSTAKTLHEVLHRHDALGQAAYVLRGAPGAGKTTLLLHHLQGLCRQALQDWACSATPAELPVYLPLADLDPGVTDIAGWVVQQLRQDGAPAALLSLLSPATREPGAPRLRLLVDGLNELRCPQGKTQNARAVEVVLALKKAFQPQVPMLLTIRDHHIDQLQGLILLHVDVQPWQPDQVQQYLQLRFPDPPAPPAWPGTPPLPAWPALWPVVSGDPRILEMCGNPLHLVGQCELFEGGWTQATRDRAALFTALLWQRLRRELGYSPHQRKTAVDPLWTDEPWLLGAQDLDAIAMLRPEDWRDAPPPALPEQGALLPALMAQAEAQWWADADTGQSSDKRCGVAVRWASVQFGGVPVEHRLPLAKAAALLGLVRFNPQGDFRFSHQAWGEWLASRRLLAAAPPDLRFKDGQLLASHPPGTMPAADWQRLLRHLTRQPFERRDVDQIRHLATANQPAWAAVPQDAWRALLRDGLSVPLGDALDATLGLARTNESELQRLARLHADHASLMQGDTPLLHFEGEHCRVNLAKVGALFGLPAVVDAKRSWPAADWPQAWQHLVHSAMPTSWRSHLWQVLQRWLTNEQWAALQRETGRLALPPREPVDEVLGLAVLGMADPRPWLQALLAAGAWAALQPVWPALQARLEPRGAHGPQAPDALLQHLRRLLLLHSVDAGATVKPRLRAGGLLDVLQPAQADMPRLLQHHWQATWASAFKKGPGLDLRTRLQAGALLGQLGDTLRYTWVREHLPGQGWREGLQLQPALWVGRGRPGARTAFRIGSDADGDKPSRPTFVAQMGHFEIAACLVTVAEWEWFWRDPRCCDASAPWWQAAGPAALRWLARQPVDVATGRPHPPPALAASGFNNGLLPITNLTHWLALAYAAWASGLYQGMPPPTGTPAPLVHGSGWRCQLPTEVQWEAGVRGATHTAPPPAGATAGAADFNHDTARWGRPSPVGAFSLGLTPDGLADTAGNVWEWCSNTLSNHQRACGYRTKAQQEAANTPGDLEDNSTERAVRGGGHRSSTDICRPARRRYSPPGTRFNDIGVRLVRLWLPHSEP